MEQQIAIRRLLQVIIGVGGVIAILSIATAQIIPPAIKGQEITVKGEVIDLWCYMRNDDHGQGHKNCSTKCATQGNPIGFLDEAKDEVYILAGKTDYQVTHEVRDELVKKMNETVTVVGTVVKKNNAQILYVKALDGKEF
jgi:hypothetical protein